MQCIFGSKTWHEIMGHCNYDDIAKLETVVNGSRPNQCEICLEGKFSQRANRQSDMKAKELLELVQAWVDLFHQSHLKSTSMPSFSLMTFLVPLTVCVLPQELKQGS